MTAPAHEPGARQVLRDLRRRTTDLVRRIPLWVQVVAMGVAMGAYLAVPVARDLLGSRDLPVEHAVVLEVREDDGFFPDCGRTDQEAAITWRSADPPAGSPAVFTDEDSCDGDEVEVGQEARIVRGDDGRVYVDPPTRWSQVAATMALGAAGGVVIRLVVRGFELVGRRRRTTQPRA